MPAKSMNEKLATQWHEDRDAAVKAISKAVEKHRGNLTAVARELNVSISTIWRWVAAEPKLDKIVKQQRIEAIRQG